MRVRVSVDFVLPGEAVTAPYCPLDATLVVR